MLVAAYLLEQLQHGARIFTLGALASAYTLRWERGRVAEVGATTPRHTPVHTV